MFGVWGLGVQGLGFSAPEIRIRSSVSRDRLAKKLEDQLELKSLTSGQPALDSCSAQESWILGHNPEILIRTTSP